MYTRQYLKTIYSRLYSSRHSIWPFWKRLPQSIFIALICIHAGIENAALAATPPVASPLNWEDQLRDINTTLRKETLSQRHAEVLKKFHAQLMVDLEKASTADVALLEKRIHLFNKMNVLFLDSFNKNRCSTIEAKWNMLLEKDDTKSFENQQMNEWIQVICSK